MSLSFQKLDAGTYRLTAEQFLPHPRDEVFDYFSKASNLEELTPPWINFNILTPDVPMRVGATIDYRLQLKGLPIVWRSEIPVWDPPNQFVDQQVKGPYKKWYHRHLFTEQGDGTLVVDKIDYAVPGGDLVNRLVVEPDLRRIFSYRQEKLAELFPATAELC